MRVINTISIKCCSLKSPVAKSQKDAMSCCRNRNSKWFCFDSFSRSIKSREEWIIFGSLFILFHRKKVYSQIIFAWYFSIFIFILSLSKFCGLEFFEWWISFTALHWLSDLGKVNNSVLLMVLVYLANPDERWKWRLTRNLILKIIRKLGGNN